VRTLVAAATLLLGIGFIPRPLPVQDQESTWTAAGNRDGGKKRKDEEKEEDFARRLGARAACVIS
jgi:hypothetical protein